MKIDKDFQERAKAVFSFGLEAYKVIMGTFLTVFVPHTCPEQDCTTLTLMARPHDVALALNYTAFASIFILYLIELQRENFLITRFDIDSAYPDIHLASVLPLTLKKTLLAYNTVYWKTSLFAMLCNVANIGVSAYYLSSRSVDGTSTAAFSFALLVFMKLSRAFALSRADAKEVRARSAYMTEHTSFNILDVDYKSFDSPCETSASQ